MSKVGVIIITHTAKKHLPHCLPPLFNSPLHPRVLVVNSSSDDGTVELAEKMGAETLVVPRAEFNHGATREKARKFLNTEIVVMLTPDAYAIDENMVGHLSQPLLEQKASLSYARQIPHPGADFFETFPRDYNYPKESHIRSLKEVEKYGVYTIFNSNSCAAYRNKALDEVGGFPTVLLGEDTLVAAALINKGHQIAYVAEAIVRHSHRYSLKQEFQRHFDIGLARKLHKDVFSQYGADEKRGWDYLSKMLGSLKEKQPSLIPYAMAHLMTKWIGYKIGQRSERAPLWWKRALSSQDFYWSVTGSNR